MCLLSWLTFSPRLSRFEVSDLFSSFLRRAQVFLSRGWFLQSVELLIEANWSSFDLIYLVGFFLWALQDAYELVLRHCSARWSNYILLGGFFAHLSVFRWDYTRGCDFLRGCLILAFVSTISAVSLTIWNHSNLRPFHCLLNCGWWWLLGAALHRRGCWHVNFVKEAKNMTHALLDLRVA